MNIVKPKISALGSYVPDGIISNADLEKIVHTNDEWILSRTGIRERRVAAPDQATSDLAVEAARAALEQRGVAASELDAIIVCTVTPDMLFPGTACLVQHKLGASKAWGFDLIAACCGFLYGLTTAANLVRSGTHKSVMVIGADTMTRIIDYRDRATCILFGDGAGAMLVEPCGRDEQDLGFIDFLGEIDGSGGEFLKMPAGGSRLPASAETVAQRQHYVHQEGQQVFKYAVRKMQEVSEALLARNGFTGKDLRFLIPHQANRRIIDSTAQKLGLDCDQVVINIDRFGNTTGGTIGLATCDVYNE